MAPLRNRAHRAHNDQDQMIEGLPIRNWRRLQGNIGAPVEEQPVVQYSRWPELPMPRDSHLLSDMSRQLLRLARLPRSSKPAAFDADQNKENGEEEEVKKSAEPKGFQIRKWSQMARDWNPPDREYVAKRRKGLPSQEGYNSLYGPDGQRRAFRSLKVKRIDGDGISHVYLCLAPVGVAVEGELPETDGGLSGPLEPRQPPGTIIDGIGIANEDGIIVAQPTPAKRRGPPPPRKKKRFFGRNKKRIETEYGPDGLPVHPPGPSDLITRPDGAQDDTQMQDANENDNDEEDEEGSGDDQEDGEEGEDEEHDDHDDHEQDDHEHDDDGRDEHDEDTHLDDGELPNSSSATPAALVSGAASATESTNVSDVGEMATTAASGLVPSSLRAEVQFEAETALPATTGDSSAPLADPVETPVAAAVRDVEMAEAPVVPTQEDQSVPAVLDSATALPTTLEPEPVVEPTLPDIPPEIPHETLEPPVETVVPVEAVPLPATILDAPAPAPAPNVVFTDSIPPIVATAPALVPAEPEIPQEPVIMPVDDQPLQSSAAIEVPDPVGSVSDSEAIVLPAISEVVPATLAVEPAQIPAVTATEAPLSMMEEEPVARSPPSAPVLKHAELAEPAVAASEATGSVAAAADVANAPAPLTQAVVDEAGVQPIPEATPAIEEPTAQEDEPPVVEQPAVIGERAADTADAATAEVQAEAVAAVDAAAVADQPPGEPLALAAQPEVTSAATPVAEANVEEPKDAQE